ncbi:MAG: PLP-dependent cysteine synthase family protein [Desulfurococcales archaeon]|nr:PLP-dependent cysteine synthase family protein [Desulfurococcales archaeon]
MRLVELDGLRVKQFISLRDSMELMSRILSEGGVRGTIVVNSGEVVDNGELYWALRRLGARLAPVSSSGVESVFTPLDNLGFYDEVVPDRFRVYNSTEELLYRNWPTPIVKLNSLSDGRVNVWAKLEFYNPFSNSIKDRIGWFMFKRALESGCGESHLLYEATSTNTGVALASMAAIHGFKAKLFLPATVQKASDVLLKVLGAEVVRVPKRITVEFVEDVDREARRDGSLHLNQFENDANFEVHLRYTAKEIDYQLMGAGIRPRAIIGGIGTSGHLSAIAFYFKNKTRNSIEVYAAQPKPGDTIPGIRRIESGMKWIHWVEIDDIIDVARDDALREMINLARSEGLLVGMSSGAVIAAFKKLRERGIQEGDYILVFPDHGCKYVEQLSEYLKRESLGT